MQSLPIYGKTKLLNIMFSIEAAARLAGTPVTAMCLNPGYNTTGLGRELGFAAPLKRALRAFGIGNPRNGARLIVRITTGDGFTSGGYFSGKNARSIAPVPPADDPQIRRQLWEATAELLRAKGYPDVY